MKKTLQIIGGMAVYCMTLTAFAMDQAAVEDTTPPQAEGPLTTDQIKPSLSPLPATQTAPATGAEPQTMLPLPSTNNPPAATPQTAPTPLPNTGQTTPQ